MSQTTPAGWHNSNRTPPLKRFPAEQTLMSMWTLGAQGPSLDSSGHSQGTTTRPQISPVTPDVGLHGFGKVLKSGVEKMWLFSLKETVNIKYRHHDPGHFRQSCADLQA